MTTFEQTQSDVIARLEEENRRLRDIVSECAAALPNGAYCAPTCSLEFMAMVPNEIRLVFGAAPSDREIEAAARATERVKWPHWDDETFAVWWDHPDFCEKVKRWQYFEGTEKARAFWLAKIALSNAYAAHPGAKS